LVCAGGARPRADRRGRPGRPSRDPGGGLPVGRGQLHEDRLDRDARGDRREGAADLLRDLRPPARPRGPRLRPDDPRPRPPLAPLPLDARLDRALRLPGLPDSLPGRSRDRDVGSLTARAARLRGDRRPLRGDAAELARAVPRTAAGGARPRLRRAVHPHLGLLPRLLRGGLPSAVPPRRPARARALIDSYWQLVLIGIGAADGLLMVLYLLQRRTGDATLVDAGWGTAIAVQAGIYGALGPGRVEHRALIA